MICLLSFHQLLPQESEMKHTQADKIEFSSQLFFTFFFQKTCFAQVKKKEPPHPIRVAKTIDVIARWVAFLLKFDVPQKIAGFSFSLIRSDWISSFFCAHFCAPFTCLISFNFHFSLLYLDDRITFPLAFAIFLVVFFVHKRFFAEDSKQSSE